jgi:hypothetical protein
MKLRALPLSLVLAGVFLLTGCREKTMPPQVAMIIRSTVESETLPASIKEQKERARAWEEMRRFYQKRQYQPAWSDVNGPRPQAEQLAQAIGSVAAAEGLDPRRYQSGQLAGILSQMKEDKSLESPEAQRRLKEAFDSIGRGTDTRGVVLELRRKDNGKPLWIQWWSRPDVSGTYTRTMFIDMTERVLMEQEQARLQDAIDSGAAPSAALKSKTSVFQSR